MNNKKLIVGSAAIVLVIAIFIISEMMSDARPPEHRTRMFPEIEERHITGFSILERGAGVVIANRDGRWTVTTISAASGNDVNDDADSDAIASDNQKADERPFPADSATVQIAIEKFLAIRTTELISENPEKRDSFETDSTKGMTVKIRTVGKEDKPFIVYVGKSGPEWGSNYVRREGTDAVYLLRGGIKHSLPADIERWKKVIPEEPVPDQDVSEGSEGSEG